MKRFTRLIAVCTAAALTLTLTTTAFANPSGWRAVNGPIQEGLTYGDAGQPVATLQGDLWQLSFDPGPVDGMFGDRTLAALNSFQRALGMAATASLNAETFARLIEQILGVDSPFGPASLTPREPTPTTARAADAPMTGAGVDASPAEVNELAHLVHAEAQAEPLQGQIAVAAVVLNRVKSTEFPNTVHAVIYQRGQFESVGNYYFTSDVVTATNREAVQRALAGEDPSRGALYFFNPAKTHSAFLWSLGQTARIGSHVFATAR